MRERKGRGVKRVEMLFKGINSECNSGLIAKVGNYNRLLLSRAVYSSRILEIPSRHLTPEYLLPDVVSRPVSSLFRRRVQLFRQMLKIKVKITPIPEFCVKIAFPGLTSAGNALRNAILPAGIGISS